MYVYVLTRIVRQLVGALSPVSHRGLHQGYFDQRGGAPEEIIILITIIIIMRIIIIITQQNTSIAPLNSRKAFYNSKQTMHNEWNRYRHHEWNKHRLRTFHTSATSQIFFHAWASITAMGPHGWLHNTIFKSQLVWRDGNDDSWLINARSTAVRVLPERNAVNKKNTGLLLSLHFIGHFTFFLFIERKQSLSCQKWHPPS